MRAELTAERATVAPGESLWVALTFTMKPKWHTYWSTPGDAGLPPQIAWTLPAGVTAGSLQFPPPEQVPYGEHGEFMNFGYSDKVTLLTEFKVAADAAPAPFTATAAASWLVCSDVCVPEDATLTLPLTIGAAPQTASTPAGAAIAAARAALPKPAPWPVSFARKDKTITLSAGPDIGAGAFSEVTFFPAEDGVLTNTAPQKTTIGDKTLRLEMTVGATPPANVSGMLVLAQNGERVGYAVAAPLTGSAAPTNAEVSAMPLVLAFVFAFLGGIILNVMPCVLPVLVMKAMSFMSRGNTDPAALRRDGLAYTAGVLVAFGALVGALIALRAAGSAVGWGFQLQSPAFVAALSYVMLALGLNLSGVFTIGGSFGVGQELASKGGATGSFFTGLLAVVVATPCTAPFMGTAVGFALTQSPLEAILVFEALGLGLAAPYLLICFVPGMARRLPRPGVWMDRVKQVLAFPLYGAAAWLIWVVAQQLEATELAGALAGLVLVGFIAWLYGTAQQSSGTGRAVALVTAALAFLATVGLTVTLGSAPPAKGAGTQAAGSEPYTAARLAALRAEGRPVFIDFTAAWCITCKVNERIALSKPEVSDAFKSANVAYLIGDWTNRNAEISAALQAVGRDGVPLYLYYGVGAKEPQVLPQVLTASTVVAAVTGK